MVLLRLMVHITRSLFQDLQTGCYTYSENVHFMSCATSTLLVSPSIRGQNKYYTPGERRSQPHARLVGSGFHSQRSHQELPAEMTQSRRTSARVVVRNCEPTYGVKTQIRSTEEFKSTFLDVARQVAGPNTPPAPAGWF